MITVTLLQNPFNHQEKDMHICEFTPGKSVYEYIQPYILGLDEYVVSVNGNVVDNAKEQLVGSDDWLAVCPVVGKHGSDWFRSIFSIALGAWVGDLSSSWKILGEKGGILAKIAAGAATYVGGILINHWFPAAKPDRIETKSTYNWSNAQSQTGQGNALAVTYGTMRTAGQVLAQHVSSDDENQYLNILLCGGEGPVDSISDIRINDNPISYYKDVIVETRLGTNDQTAIANFGDVYDDQPLAYELNTDSTWVTQQTEGNAVEGLEVTLDFPGGLYYVNDKGNLTNASVTIQLQYHKVGDTAWSDFATAAVTAAKNNAFFRTYRLDHLPAAQYEVRAQCTYKSGTSTRYSTRVYWTQLSSIMYDDFSRPGKVLIGIKALATSQLSGGMPAITWLQTRDTVWVWNAEKGAYEQKAAANPAWAAYDMIHRCRRLKNIHTGDEAFAVQGAPASRAVYQDFVRWAAFCEERKLTFNYIFDTADELWTLLQKPEGAGRGKVIMRGTKFGCVCDAPGEPVQLFTVGNILADKFTETFVGLKDRANAIEVSFPNKDKAYEKEVITVYADDYDAAGEPNITQITLDGITTVEQAYREAKYRLRLNQYLLRTVEHSADIDAIACQINDVVLLAHDVPQWGFSGRLLNATATTLQLDREVTLEPSKSYAIAVQVTNTAATTGQEVQNIVTVPVQGVYQQTVTDTITLNTALSTLPQKWDLYSFGETNKVVKPFRVLKISRDQDLRQKITCLEYIEDIYNEATDIPAINYSELDTALEVSGVKLNEETYCQKDGTMVSNLNVSWSIPRTTRVSGYKVLYSSDNGTTWNQWCSGITALSTSITGVKTKTTYWVRVCTINDLGAVSNGVEASLDITGKDDPPSNVASLSAAIDPSDRTKVTLTWPGVTDIDLNGYRVMERTSVLTPTPISDNRYIYTAAESREHAFSVVAVDNSGNFSQVPATVALFINVEPLPVKDFYVQQKDTDRSRLVMTWEANSEKDLSYYEIRDGDDWENARLIATQLKATALEYQLPLEGNYRFMIKAFNVSGHGSVLPAVQTLTAILRPDAPVNLAAVQEPRDSSVVKISWEASPGKDIAGYELKYGDTGWDSGVPVATVADPQCAWYVPASGSYTIMVRAKTVAGYYSNVANLSVAPMIEPYDVTNFSAVQSASDRTKITLSWDTPLSLDVSYFIIKKGISWDAGQVVGQRVTGTFYDVLVSDETEQTFWIKAVSTAGHESQNPARTSNVFSLNPSAVSEIQIQQNPNDKSVLNIMWTGVNESDLTGYQVKIGDVWESAEALPITQELYSSYSLKKTGNVKVMIKTLNAAGYYSDEASTSKYVTLEPAEVTNLVVCQNGETVELYWDKAEEPDVVTYEIHEGANYDQGSIVAGGITQNSYVAKVDTERSYQYFVKAVNRSGHYSQRAASQPITVTNLPVRNIIQTFDEIALADGTHDNTELGVSLINFSNMGGSFDSYPTTKFSDVGGKTVLKLLKQTTGTYPATGSYTCRRIDIGQVITANITAQFVSTVILKGTGSAILQICTSLDNVRWTAWQDFRPAQYTFRYAGFRVLLGTTDPAKTPEVNQCLIKIDVPDKDLAQTVTVPAGGKTFSYGTSYYTVPVITPTAIGEGLHAQLIDKTKTGYTLKIKDSSNIDVGGLADIRIKGY